jgi:hypothetical protein
MQIYQTKNIKLLKQQSITSTTQMRVEQPRTIGACIIVIVRQRHGGALPARRRHRRGPGTLLGHKTPRQSIDGRRIQVQQGRERAQRRCHGHHGAIDPIDPIGIMGDRGPKAAVCRSTRWEGRACRR